jgi:UDP-3-O-[3-hydroxymyristoyl] glucosamine N-acyltransferase
MKLDSNQRIPSLTTGKLAELTGGILEGLDNVIISGIAEANLVKPGEITYAVNEKYVSQLLLADAGCAIIPSAVGKEVTFSYPVIRSSNPALAFAIVLKHFERKPNIPEVLIHPSVVVAISSYIGSNTIVGPHTVIDEDSRIGTDSRIGSNCYIGNNVTIGKNTVIAPNVTIRDDSVIGDRVIIHSGTVIGTDGYGFIHTGKNYVKIPQIGHVEIGDDVEIGSMVCIDRATIGKTIIGKGTKIDNLVQIGHNVVLGENCALVSQVGISGSTIVGDNCRFAGQAATSGHLTIGNNTTIAARGVAMKDIPPNSFVSGFPARPHIEEQKIKAALPKLPELIKKIRKLEKDIQQMKETVK